MRKLSKLYLLSVFILSLYFLDSCQNGKTSIAGEHSEPNFARGFDIKKNKQYTLVHVYDPWKEGRVLHTYVLVPKKKARPSGLPAGTIVEVPVDKIACWSSVDAYLLYLLGDSDKIKILYDTRYITRPSLIQGLKSGKFADGGNSTNPDIEKLMDIHPDILILAPFKNQGYGKLDRTGISIVEDASYMENDPLGRAEWIKFLAAFTGKELKADSIMKDVSEKYLSLKKKTGHVKYRPEVFSEMKFSGIWGVPGGRSYVANLFKDAGADYLWSEDRSAGSLSLNFEQVYDKAGNADYWVIKNFGEMTYGMLKKEDNRYCAFRAWKERHIIYCNTAVKDYFEEGVMRPDLVLSDLISFFHPELLSPSYKRSYFEFMKDEK